MKPAAHYKGREQTYLKHFFLERYLETVGFHIGYAHQEFIYVDCFSGPWRQAADDLADTSIRIALDKLNYVREALVKKNKAARIRALFIEKDQVAFAALREATEQYQGSIQAVPLLGSFEDLIPRILREIGPMFAFCFIDPTGWTGLSPQRIQPLLRHRPGEVMINFMYDFVNRFVNSEDPAIESSLDAFFGTQDWRRLRDTVDRETAIVEFYADRVRTTGEFRYVTYTRILKPLHERAYFYLVYATRNAKGIQEFRKVEREFVTEQEHVRANVQREDREGRSGQSELEFGDSHGLSSTLLDARAAQRIKARQRLFEVLRLEPRKYGTLLPELLQLPLFWKQDLNELLLEEQRDGRISIDGMTERQRVPSDVCVIRILESA